MPDVQAASGRSQRFITSGRKEKHQLDSATVETKTQWDGDKLVKEISAGSGLKVTETYSLSDNSRQLLVTIKVENWRLPQPLLVRRVYDDALAR